MNNNHLIIGLGGTGGKIIRAFRKTIYQEFRNNKNDKVNIEYLYVDSSSEMMSLDDSTWKILGKSVQLAKNQQLLIKGGADLKAHLDNINNYPGIKNWIGNKEQWQDILNSIVGEVLGGQKRRLGRFLFACKIVEFKQQLQGLVRDLQNTGLKAVTFHVCCGLAGGTGSGSIIDVVAQIRALYPDVRDYRIIIYALLPDTHPKPNWDTGNYHANGYAALMELNSLSVGAWQPHDITGIKERLELKDPFNGCYLFFNENENGLSVDVNEDILNIVADFLYQKLVTVQAVGWDNLGRMENAENGDGTPECAPSTQRAERSKRFLAFGIKRLIVPEQEIKEYITYQFAHQSSLQMLFNNWFDSISFAEEAKNLAFGEEVRKPETQQRWSMTNEHLCLSIGILKDELDNRRWKTISADWQHSITVFKQLAQEKESQAWLDELELLCQRRFTEQYRDHGVLKFYDIKEAAHKDHAKEIRYKVEKELFQDWQNGTRSIHEIIKLVDALLDAVEDRYKETDDKIIKHRDYATEANNKVIANRKEWLKVGIISGFLGKKDKLLEAQALCLQEKYSHLTYERAWQFVKVLLATLKTELNALRTEVSKAMNLLTETSKDFQTKIDQRCNETGQSDLRKPVVQFYKPPVIREFTQYLLRDKKLQYAQTARVRAALIEKLGDNPDFSAFNNRLLRQQFIDIVEDKCEQTAIEAHNNLIATERDKAPQLNVSIIEKLAREFSGNEEGLKIYMQGLVDHAGNYLIFNPAEVTKRGLGIPESPTKVTQFTVILPKSPELVDFVKNLKDIIRGRHNNYVEIIEAEVKSEISFISLSNLFPLRFVKQIDFLKERYDNRMSKVDKDRAQLELHCETDGVNHPSLFIASTEDLKQQGLPFVLIANVLGIVQNYTSPSTGKTEILLMTKDADGFDNDPIRLGVNLIEAVNNLDAQNVETIRIQVQKLLKTDCQHLDKKNELKQKILNVVNEIKAERQNDIDDLIYKRFKEAGKKSMQLIETTGG